MYARAILIVLICQDVEASIKLTLTKAEQHRSITYTCSN